MVGIILASHGQFAEGILQSGQLIFGKQDNVKAVTLAPNEGPDDIHKKLEDAVASFDDPEQVLILVDLWGGTPFNQSSSLFEDHKENWAIVTGLNLPMLVEAFGSRMTENSAQKIAAHILQAAKDGVKIKPESLQPTPAAKEPATAQEEIKRKAVHGTLPEGTVVGNGKIELALVRIDSRLLHGQVATTWAKTRGINRILVVSDSVARDAMRKKLIEQAAPPEVKANVIPVQKMVDIYSDPRFGNTRALLLFEKPEDLVKVIDKGIKVDHVNVGSMAHSVGKVAVSHTISMGPADIKAFKELQSHDITFDTRKVPSDKAGSLEELMRKAEAGLKDAATK